MSKPDRPGFLGSLFDDNQEQLPDHLTWDALADGIPGPLPQPVTERPADRAVLLPLLGWVWGAVFTVGVIGSLIYSDLFQPNVTISADAPPSSIQLPITEPDCPPDTPMGAAKKELPPGISVNLTLKMATSTVTRRTTGPAFSPANGPYRRGTTYADNTESAAFNRTVTPRFAHENSVLPLSFPITTTVRCLSCPDVNVEVILPHNQFTERPERRRSAAMLDVAAGGNRPGRLPAGLNTLTGWSFSGAYRLDRPSGWSFSAGLRFDQSTWNSRLERSDSTLLFRPGTVDTIFSNLTTGEERIVTRDSVPGTRTTRFRGYGQIRTVGLELRAGRDWPVLGGRFLLMGSLRADYILNVSGRTVAPEGEITQATALARPAGSLLFGVGGAARFEQPVYGRLSAFGETGHHVQLGPALDGYGPKRITNWQFLAGVSIRLQ